MDPDLLSFASWVLISDQKNFAYNITPRRNVLADIFDHLADYFDPLADYFDPLADNFDHLADNFDHLVDKNGRETFLGG